MKVVKKVESAAVVARRWEVARIRKERTQQALMAAAFDLLGREYGRIANVDVVVAQAGVTRATFYNHYTSLEELLRSLSRHMTHDFNAQVIDYIGSISSPPEQSAIFIKAHLQKAYSAPRWGWGMVNLSLYGPIFGYESNRLTESNIQRGIDSGDYTCTSVSAGCDVATGALFAAMTRILKEGNSKGYIPEVVRGILLSWGVAHERARALARKRLPSKLNFIN